MRRLVGITIAIFAIAGGTLSCDEEKPPSGSGGDCADVDDSDCEGPDCDDVGEPGEYDTTGFQFTLVESTVLRPSFATAPPGDTSRLFITEQWTGQIRILSLPGDTLLTTPFLDLDDLRQGSEQGLLGLAFHPDYATNGYFYVSYIDGSGDTVIERYQRSDGDPNVADAGTASLVLALDQPLGNHNGGWIGFGPDEYLYISLGDGGGAHDEGPGRTPGGNAQDITDNLLGAMLRIDIDGTDAYPSDPDRNYAIPPTNPFVDEVGDDEIWAYGLRNPWRPSFDRETGDLWISDVGQRSSEEIDFQPADSPGGENYGWRLREGVVETPTRNGGGPLVGGDRPPGNVDPIFAYPHSGGTYSGCSITGGYVYRGPIAALVGAYFFADFCSGQVASLRFDGSDPACFDGENYVDFRNHAGVAPVVPGPAPIANVSSFAEDAQGNLYVMDNGGGFSPPGRAGKIYRIEVIPPAP
jgi:glucose/arabinose dehydrogenase